MPKAKGEPNLLIPETKFKSLQAFKRKIIHNKEFITVNYNPHDIDIPTY